MQAVLCGHNLAWKTWLFQWTQALQQQKWNKALWRYHNNRAQHRLRRSKSKRKRNGLSLQIDVFRASPTKSKCLFFSTAIYFPVTNPKLQQNSFKTTLFHFPQDNRAISLSPHKRAMIFPLENSAWRLLQAQNVSDVKLSVLLEWISRVIAVFRKQTVKEEGRMWQWLFSRWYFKRFQSGKKLWSVRLQIYCPKVQKWENVEVFSWCISLAEYEHMADFSWTKIDRQGVHLHRADYRTDPATTDFLWSENTALCPAAAGGAGCCLRLVNIVVKPCV